jgi:hypothetical protein
MSFLPTQQIFRPPIPGRVSRTWRARAHRRLLLGAGCQQLDEHSPELTGSVVSTMIEVGTILNPPPAVVE